MQATSISRREFLQKTGVGCASVLARGVASAAVLNSIGYSTISWPQEEFEHALDTISGLGFQGVQLVGWARERYANRSEVLRDKLQRLNLTPVAQSCWGVKLDPDNPADNSDVFRLYAEFAKSLGGSILQVTDSGKPDGKYSAGAIRTLGEKMNDLGRVAQDHGLLLGYHPHVGSYGETKRGIQDILGATDAKYLKLVADTGHLALGGMDPSKIIRQHRERLILMHLKDVRRDAWEAATRDRTSLRGRKFLFCEIGKGALDLPEILRTLGEIQFQGWSIVELDGNETSPGGPDDGAHVNREGLRQLGWGSRN